MRLVLALSALIFSAPLFAQSSSMGVVQSAELLNSTLEVRCQPRAPVTRQLRSGPVEVQPAPPSCGSVPLPQHCAVTYLYEGRRYRTITNGCPAIGSLIEVRPIDRPLR